MKGIRSNHWKTKLKLPPPVLNALSPPHWEICGDWKIRWVGWGYPISSNPSTPITPYPLNEKRKKNSQNVARHLRTGKCWYLRPVLLVGLTLYWDRWLYPPAELTNPSHPPSFLDVCVCVGMCFTPQKENNWQASCGKHGGLMCFGLVIWRQSAMPPLVCVCVHPDVCFENHPWMKTCLSIFLENVDYSWLAWH